MVIGDFRKEFQHTPSREMLLDSFTLTGAASALRLQAASFSARSQPLTMIFAESLPCNTNEDGVRLSALDPWQTDVPTHLCVSGIRCGGGQKSKFAARSSLDGFGWNCMQCEVDCLNAEAWMFGREANGPGPFLGIWVERNRKLA
jgi:hypothetical protein